MSVLAERLEEAFEKTKLDAADVGRVVGATGRTVSRWMKAESEPRSQARERLLELLAVVDGLARTLRPEVAHDWLFAPNPALGHNKPVDLLKDGEYRLVLGAIDALGEGVFV